MHLPSQVQRRLDAYLSARSLAASGCLGGAYLDRPPDYSEEVWRDWREEKSEAFEDDWPVVEEILATFRMFGIYIADVNPGNIRFQND